jgi:hypothetical protein
MLDSDVDECIEMVDRLLADTTPRMGRDLEKIRKRLLESSLGCYHRNVMYSKEERGRYYGTCDHCGKRVVITKEQFDKSAKGVVR